MAKMSIPDFMQIRREGRKIACMTAYDYNTARILDRAGADMLLVGDSGARYLLGHNANNDATMDEMVLMTRSVARGAERAFVIGDNAVHVVPGQPQRCPNPRYARCRRELSHRSEAARRNRAGMGTAPGRGSLGGAGENARSAGRMAGGTKSCATRSCKRLMASWRSRLPAEAVCAARAVGNLNLTWDMRS
jgi:hypothetical protein